MMTRYSAIDDEFMIGRAKTYRPDALSTALQQRLCNRHLMINVRSFSSLGTGVSTKLDVDEPRITCVLRKF